MKTAKAERCEERVLSGHEERKKRMRTLCGFVLAGCLALVARGAMATSTIYTSEAPFTAQLAPGYYLNDFNYDPVRLGLPPHYYTLGNLPSFTSGVWSYTLSSPPTGPVWELETNGGSVQVAYPYEAMIVTFTGAPVTAVGGLFFGTTAPGPFIAATITVNLSDGTNETFSSSLITDFRGFIASSVPISSLSISDSTGSYAALDHLYVGAAVPQPLAAVPEPITMLAMVSGIVALGGYLRKRVSA